MRTGSAQLLPPVISPTKGTIQKPLNLKSKSLAPSLSSDSFNLQLKNLDKYIRSNDVATILKDTRALISPTRDNKDILHDEIREASSNLAYLRKKCDDVSETCLKRENEITKYRGNIENLKAKEDQILETVHNNANRLGSLKNALELQQNKIDEAVQTKRVYSRMLERLKKDKITDKIKVARLETLLMDKLHQLTNEIQNATRAKQFETQTKVVFDGVLKQVEHEDRQRQESLNVFERTLLIQEEAEQKRTERIAINQAVAENAFSDFKNSNSNKWRDLQLAHKFVSFFLKRKIEREIQQYEHIEKAYQKIKASTGLADMKEIVTKFVNREQTYSELLISIADYEKKISEHRKINEHLKKGIQNLKEQNIYQEKMREEKLGSKSDLLDIYKNLNTVSESYENTKLKVEKTYWWVVQTLVKIDKAKRIAPINYYETLPKNNIGDAFIKVIEMIKGELGALKANNVDEILDEIDSTKVEQEIKAEEFVSRNIRVKPMAKFERVKTSETGLFSRKSLVPENTEANEFDIADNHHHHHHTEDPDNIEAQRSHIRNRVIEDAIKAKKMQEKKEKEEYYGR